MVGLLARSWQDGAQQLFTVPLTLCLICAFSLLVLVLVIATEMSRPLQTTAAESSAIAASIGKVGVDHTSTPQFQGAPPPRRVFGVLLRDFVEFFCCCFQAVTSV